MMSLLALGAPRLPGGFPNQWPQLWFPSPARRLPSLANHPKKMLPKQTVPAAGFPKHSSAYWLHIDAV